ncbi:MAG: mechanosensitive ion channel family protein [Gemmatimonadaceae bacterium]|nr:mechanosensitive ion channel family protein [Gemmatimonadaceae bacterium]
MLVLVAVAAAVALFVTPLRAQAAQSGANTARVAAPDSAPPAATASAASAAVVSGVDTVLIVPTRMGAFSASARAEAIASRLRGLWRTPLDSLVLVAAETSTDIVAGEMVLMSVSDADAAARGVSRAALAEEFREQLWEAIERASLAGRMQALIGGLWRTMLATAVLIVVLLLIRRGYARFRRWLDGARATLPSVRIKTLELIPSTVLAAGIESAAKLLRLVLYVVLFYFYVPLVLSFFPWTAPYADRLLSYLLSPVTAVLLAIGTYLPNVLFVAVIVTVTRYLLKAIRLVFEALGRGTLAIGGFEREWADPTYKIARFLIIAFSLVVVFPYLPGADSEAFKGVSLFVGVLISFGSSSAISNAIAGVVLTYTRAFRVGDMIAIAETQGTVTAKSLLVTRVRTIKDVEVTIPNAMVLAAHVQNFSTLAAGRGLILHTGVTIGYDVPWREVHRLLLAAAAETPGVIADPKPFVLQTSLDDFYVSYQLNVYSRDAQVMARTYSALHANILDQFHSNGVEILSPHYRAVRDGNAVAGPEGAAPGAFRVQQVPGDTQPQP